MTEAEALNSFTVDKTGWPEGPWMEEPDRLQWRSEAGLPGLIVRNAYGGLCGYAAVPPGHPLHGTHYDDVEVDVEMHGGLTYSDRCVENGPICHIPEPGEPEDVWWFGLDCGHGWDYMPGIYKRRIGSHPPPQCSMRAIALSPMSGARSRRLPAN